MGKSGNKKQCQKEREKCVAKRNNTRFFCYVIFMSGYNLQITSKFDNKIIFFYFKSKKNETIRERGISSEILDRNNRTSD